jgi:hypothetical protein
VYLFDPVDDPVCLVPPIHGGLHPVLQQSVQHSILLHRVGVHALGNMYRLNRLSHEIEMG